MDDTSIRARLATVRRRLVELTLASIRDWAARWRYPEEGEMAARQDLRRFAKMRAAGMSFGSAFALGLGLGHVDPQRARKSTYNGAGFTGDKDAVAGDFQRAVESLKARDTSRG